MTDAANRRLGRSRMQVGLALLASIAFISAAALISGCSSDASGSSSSESISDETLAIDMDSMDFEYTDRDQDASYDESESTLITLSDGATEIDGEGASVDGDVVTISEEGTYIVNGELSDGQLVVNIDSESKAQVVLAGVDIHNEDGPAIYIMQADKVFLTLADGTDNVLTDGSEYELEDDSDEPYATLFSKDDLTINGSGSLTVTSSYRHAICSKDDLVITGGTFVVTSAEDALRGRDCVKILDGTFTISSGEDAVKSNNDEDGTRGYVCIDGGTFYIEAGDDAIHAETVLIVNDGTVEIATSYEGLEAEQVYVNGGTIDIVSSDDGINASARSTVTGVESDDSAADLTDVGAGDAAASGDFGGPGDPSSDMSEADGGAIESGDAFFDTEADPGVVRSDGGAMGGYPGGDVPDAGSMDGGTGGVADGGMTSSNASESCLVQINGGYVTIDAGGDALDSNGYLEINGGTVLANGPASGDDFALDSEYTASINGGTVLMLGSTTMVETFGDGTQAYVFANASGNAGDEVSLVDGDGNVVVTYTAPKSFQLVMASIPDLAEGDTLTVVIGATVSEDGTVSGGTSMEVTAQSAS